MSAATWSRSTVVSCTNLVVSFFSRQISNLPGGAGCSNCHVSWIIRSQRPAKRRASSANSHNLAIIPVEIGRNRARDTYRAVQRSVLVPDATGFHVLSEREVDDSAGRKSLNLCEATKSLGGRHEIVRAISCAARDDSRPASRRGQTLSVTARAAVFRFRHGERRQFVSRHPHLPQGASAKAEQSLRDQVEEAAGAYRDPLYLAGAEPGRCRKGLS